MLGLNQHLSTGMSITIMQSYAILLVIHDFPRIEGLDSPEHVLFMYPPDAT